MTVPKHEYETTEGSAAAPLGQHEARTLKHTVTNSSPESVAAQATELYMMIEIGDGVFVQIGSCSKCNKRVADCTCVGGPQQQDFIDRWRDQRFERSFNTRPEPTLPEIPTVVQYLKDRGYTVTKKREPKPPQAKDPLVVQVGQSADEVFYPGTPDEEPTPGEVMEDHNEEGVAAELRNEGVDPEKVDAGLNDALAKVRAAKLNADDFVDDF